MHFARMFLREVTGKKQKRMGKPTVTLSPGQRLTVSFVYASTSAAVYSSSVSPTKNTSSGAIILPQISRSRASSHAPSPVAFLGKYPPSPARVDTTGSPMLRPKKAFVLTPVLALTGASMTRCERRSSTASGPSGETWRERGPTARLNLSACGVEKRGFEI